MDETTENPQGPEEAGPDLSHLLAEADAIEGAQVAAQAQAEAQAAQSTIEANREGLRDALGMARMIAAPAFGWWDDFGQCWSDRQLDAISEAGAQVMQRHGVTMGELMSQWGPYIALIGATVPPGLATYTAVKARKAEQAKPQGNPGQRVTVQPQAGPVAPPVSPTAGTEGIRL